MTTVRTPARICAARVPRTICRSWYSTSATARISSTAVRLSRGKSKLMNAGNMAADLIVTRQDGRFPEKRRLCRQFQHQQRHIVVLFGRAGKSVGAPEDALDHGLRPLLRDYSGGGDETVFLPLFILLVHG